MHLAARVLAAGADFRLVGMAASAICVEQAGGGGVRHAHRLWQEPDEPRRGPCPAGSTGCVWRWCATRCRTATCTTCACSGSARWPTSMPATPPSRSAKSTSCPCARALRCTRASTTATSSPWPSTTPTWCCGTAATTTCRSTCPNLMIVVADALRPGHETAFHPSEANVLLADVLVVNKVDSASRGRRGDRHRRVAGAEPRRDDAARVRPATLDAGSVDRGHARAGGGGRAHHHPRRHAVRRRHRGGSSRRGGTAGGSAAVRRGFAAAVCTRSTRTSAQCCRRWATATCNSPISPPPSPPHRATWWCRARRSTSPRRWGRTTWAGARSDTSPTTSTTARSASWPRCSRRGSSAGSQRSALESLSVTLVPRSPASTAAASTSEPMAANPPVRSTNRQAASTFGPIEPAGNAERAQRVAAWPRRIGSDPG